MRLLITGFLGCLLPFFLTAQISLRGGISLALGRPVLRAGLFVQASYQQEWFLTGAGAAVFRNGRSFGPKGAFWEAQLSATAGVGFGPPRLEGRTYDLSYTWLVYADTRQTSQFTGRIGVGAGPFNLWVENDGFSWLRPADQFRTGSFSLSYSKGIHNFELVSALWTGQTRCASSRTYRNSPFPGRWGFRDIRDCLYGGHSNGLLFFRYTRQLDYGQTIGASVGIDSERWRHLLQNRMVHDFPPLRWQWLKPRNPHYPMLTPEGDLYLGLPGQRWRPARLVYGIGLNETGGY